jgi:hypothetical protein
MKGLGAVDPGSQVSIERLRVLVLLGGAEEEEGREQLLQRSPRRRAYSKDGA